MHSLIARKHWVWLLAIIRALCICAVANLRTQRRTFGRGTYYLQLIA